ncbi:MAG: 4a-hydroxytetrahydrobiopterin dehydratase [Pseudomonadota bacterium]
MNRLTDHEIEQQLKKLHQQWQLVEGKLHRVFLFSDFVEAFGFMTRAALLAEKMNHHPEWSNVYRRVEVDLMTHEAGGITQKDIELAQAMDKIGIQQ